ncbi:uncharacterized protein [Chironomus tepperi]|uniref:uncharacterized protein isoform X2 n=1 Tax=Chironomus tepperi TaxID=113505 RepID=UPI00391F9F68
MYFLPDEVLLQVFRHLKNDCDQVKQVCRRFYLLICEFYISNTPLFISDKQDRETYDSMVFSRRIFNKMELNTNHMEFMESFRRLRTICALKAKSITELEWHSAKMTPSEIVLVLNFFTNLKTLKCDSWKILTEFYDERIEISASNSLKSFSLIRCDQATKAFFIDYLPTNCLTKLETDFYCPFLISCQSELNELSFSTEEMSPEWISVPLKKLTVSLQRYRTDGQPVLRPILQQQPNLISLNILSCNGIFDGDDDSFITMCNLKHLKVLKMNIDDINHIVFKSNFDKLDKLEELHIESVDGEFLPLVHDIEELSNTKLEHLKTLTIDVSHIGIPIDRIEKMGINFPKLTKLSYKCEYPLPIDKYLNNFNALTELLINYHYGQNFAEMCKNLDDTTFPLLNRVELRGFNFGSDADTNEPAFTKLVKALPNVTFMAIEINVPLNTRLLDINLKRLPKLKIFKDIQFIHQKENYEKFDATCINYFLGISKNYEEFQVELKLKAIDMDLNEMINKLKTNFKVKLKRCISVIVINLQSK